MRIVLVLYKTALLKSAAYTSLIQALATTGLQARTSLVICDNSPLPQTADTLKVLDGHYRHQPENPGLAASYNYALEQALAADEPWMMLLDQDTQVTGEYLQQVFAFADSYLTDMTVVALAPKLAQHDKVHSPESSIPQEQMANFHGPAEGTLRVFNSGAVLRTAALVSIGGFPRQFWLDFLDHATFHLLQQRGKVVVLPVTLAHELFTNSTVKAWNGTYLRRHGNLLRAEAEFYRSYGTPLERRQHRLRLLRHACGSLKHMHLPVAWQTLAVLLKGR